jgi:hypothetical protein
MPPDLLNMPSLHCMMYPRPFQKLSMQSRYAQISPAGLKMYDPPQKV